MRKANKDNQLLKRRNIIIDDDDNEPLSPPGGSSYQKSPVQLLHIDEIILNMNSDKIDVKYNATMNCRKMLSKERNPPIDEMINKGIVPKCVEFLSYEDQ